MKRTDGEVDSGCSPSPDAEEGSEDLGEFELLDADPEALRRLARFLGVNTVGADDETIVARIGVQLSFSTQLKKSQL